MRKIIFFILLLSVVKFAKAQINLVPNPNFDFGGTCECGTVTEDGKNLNLDNWDIAGPKDKDDDRMPTPDWYKYPDCDGRIPIDLVLNGVFPKLFSNSVVGMGTEKSDEFGWQEGVRVLLKENLKAGKTYILKMKIGLLYNIWNTPDKNLKISIHFAKWGEHWNKNPNFTNANVLWKEAHNFWQFTKNIWDWKFTSHIVKFTAPESVEGGSVNDLKNLIIKHHYDNDILAFNYTLIDDIELYEVDNTQCHPNWVIENIKYEYEEIPIEAGQTIVAGKSVLDNNDDGMVVCDGKTDPAYGDSRVIYKAGERITLKDGFRVKKDAYFRGYIAPCGKECFTPAATGNFSDINICNNSKNCFNIGGNAEYGMTYEWTSDNSQILSFLNHTDISNPELCIPANFATHGTYFLTVKISNKCNEMMTKKIKIVINRDNYNNASPIYINTFCTGTFGGWYANGSPSKTHWTCNSRIFNTDEVKFEVIDLDNNIIHTKSYYIGIDFFPATATYIPTLFIDYWDDNIIYQCDNIKKYKFKFTLTNKCTNTSIIEYEYAKFPCYN